ncbi:hypothetical protein OPV22_026638 [Ensete ventricosum]|uniref:Uncharacterized protein n=1 Tax=Ensete ventricosum TaxID=4639 RepID=A0AAV8QKF4_ENSVE|nr:hypothetical protein OPV22_026638 [Ensete ventricosum]
MRQRREAIVVRWPTLCCALTKKADQPLGGFCSVALQSKPVEELLVALHLSLTMDSMVAPKLELLEEWHGGGKEEAEDDGSSTT